MMRVPHVHVLFAIFVVQLGFLIEFYLLNHFLKDTGKTTSLVVAGCFAGITGLLAFGLFAFSLVKLRSGLNPMPVLITVGLCVGSNICCLGSLGFFCIWGYVDTAKEDPSEHEIHKTAYSMMMTLGLSTIMIGTLVALIKKAAKVAEFEDEQ
ncbi:unnamed protein product [Caenorhabditis auriculariae]|uniref:Uncharacterized protein n=1 Tax=Caenorhabditis auriculariae TaxID=2777116 RepID=A0A8S1HHK8_9PELO|nr:unnamed protein product [Caenorhabditis auriculariae]